MKLFVTVTRILGVRRLSGHTVLTELLKDGPAILDCGTHKGDFQLALSKDGITARQSVCVEANPILAQHLRDTLPQAAQIIHAAVTGDSGQKSVTFNVSKNPEASSLFSEISNTYGSISKTVVPCITLTDLLSFFQTKGIDLVKCDIEGAEINVILNEKSDTLLRIKTLSVEFHDNFCPNMSQDVKRCRARLNKLGFLELNANWPYTDDILFVNKKSIPPLKGFFCRLVVLKTLFVLRGLFFLLLRRLTFVR